MRFRPFRRALPIRTITKARTAAELHAERELNAALKDIGGEVERAFRRAVESLRSDIDMGALTSALRSGNLKRAEDIVGAASITERMGQGGKDSVLGQLSRALETGGESAARQLPSRIREPVGSLDLTNPEAIRYLRETRPSLIQEVSLSTQEAVREVLQRGMEEGLPAPRMAREIRNLVGLTQESASHVQNLRRQLETGVIDGQTPPWERRLSAAEARQARRLFDQENPSPEQIDALVTRYAEQLTDNRAKSIARTETHRAFEEGKQAIWDQAEQKGYLDKDTTRQFWLVTGDERLRESHKAIPGMNPKGVPLGGMFKTPFGDVTGPGDENPGLIGCFLPGTLVRGAFLAGLKARYSGDAIELVTARGLRLAVTPNHPVLTRAGFRRAGDIAEGDDLIANGDQVFNGSTGNIDEEDRPALIEDVFEALAKSGGARSLPVSSLDLHGDEMGMEGDVWQVGPDRILQRYALTSLGEKVPELDFVPPDITATLGVGGSGLDPYLESGLASPDGGMGFPYLVVPVGGGHHRPLDALRFGLGADLDSAFEEHSVNRSPGNPERFGKSIGRLTGVVSTDKIVSVRRFPFAGHVYDLQSTTGYLVAGGIIVSNCRCTVYLEVNE